MKSLYETLPVQMASDMKIGFLNENGTALDAGGSPVRGVREIVLSRAGGGARIRFARPVGIALISEPLKSAQATTVYCRAIHVELPTRLGPQDKCALSYDLIPIR